MADNVQHVLDRLSDTFQAMREVEAFSEQEMKSIVQKITDFEYMMVRPQLSLDDIQRYLDYALQLHELLHLRLSNLLKSIHHAKKNLITQLKKQSIRHVNYIFFRSTRRFLHHHSLWQNYIDFLRSNNSNSLLNDLFGRLLSLFPKNESYWLQAASHELHTNSNSHASRILLQRALRMNNRSQNLWLKYFEMEIWYILKIEERQTILSIDETATSKLFDTPYIIFTHAIESIPNNIEFAVEFYRVSLHTTIYALIRRIEKTLFEAMSEEPLLWKYMSVANLTLIDKFISSSDLKRDYPQLSNIFVAILGCSEYTISLLEDGQHAIPSNYRHTYALIVEDICELYLEKVMTLLSIIPSAYSEDSSNLGNVLSSWQSLMKRILILCSSCQVDNSYTYLNVRLSINRLTTVLGSEAFDETHPSSIVKVVLHEMKAFSTSLNTAQIEYSSMSLYKILCSLLRSYADSQDDLIIKSISELSENILRSGTLFASALKGYELLTQCVEIVLTFSTNASIFDFLNSILQQIILGKNTLRPLRVQWCVYYLQIQLVLPNGKFLDAYIWIEKTLQANPFLVTDLDLSEIYRVVLNYCTSETDKGNFKKAVQRAVERCPSEKMFWEHYERILREEGDHKAANHVRWLAAKA